jgi:hypothetical protein
MFYRPCPTRQSAAVLSLVIRADSIVQLPVSQLLQISSADIQGKNGRDSGSFHNTRTYRNGCNHGKNGDLLVGGHAPVDAAHSSIPHVLKLQSNEEGV